MNRNIVTIDTQVDEVNVQHLAFKYSVHEYRDHKSITFFQASSLQH